MRRKNIQKRESKQRLSFFIRANKTSRFMKGDDYYGI